MPRILITDTTLRDAHQSLLATRMRTVDMLPICEKMDAIGFWSLEVWGGATYDACLRFLKEDPWERLRALRKALPNTQLQMLLRGQNLLGYRHYADDVVREFVKRAATNGIDVFRIFDAMNDLRNLSVSIEAVKKAAKHAQGVICYTTSPVHTVAQFVRQAVELEQMDCDSIAIKDMAGLLVPSVCAELVTQLRNKIGIPIHLHSHSTAGLASMCHYEAIRCGAAGIDTAISSLSGGTSHPPTESMVAALRGTDFDTGLDLERLQEIGFYFYDVRKKYKRFESDYTGVDTRVQVNQVPGGMISNLSHQLKQQDALSRMPEVLREIPIVRKDLGYPPLVTPTSQIVGTQAVINVLNGERYKIITNEVKLYLQGKYGHAPGNIDLAVRRKAIGNAEIIDVRPADLLPIEMDRLRKEIGGLALNEEDILSYAMFPEVGKTFLEERAAGTLTPETMDAPESITESARKGASEFNISLHGETYHIKITGTGLHTQDQTRLYYMSVDGLPEEIMVENLDEIPLGLLQGGAQSVQTSAAPVNSGEGRRARATQPGHVTAAMPCTIVDVLVAVNDKVQAGQAIVVTEAMKMETEIHAPIGGSIKAVHVKKGDAVTPHETLIEIE